MERGPAGCDDRSEWRACATVTATEELSNFGTDVRIAVPPDSSVVDISDLAG